MKKINIYYDIFPDEHVLGFERKSAAASYPKNRLKLIIIIVLLIFCFSLDLQELKESFNYGLFCPPSNGKAGKFLDEERRLGDYPFNGPVGYLEVSVNCVGWCFLSFWLIFCFVVVSLLFSINSIEIALYFSPSGHQSKLKLAKRISFFKKRTQQFLHRDEAVRTKHTFHARQKSLWKNREREKT